MQTYIRPASTLLLFTGLALIASAQQAPAPAPAAPAAPPPPMGFFITSENPGKGGDLGGLAGADAHCQKLATAVGAGSRTWRAYLSTPAGNGKPAVHADRIGSGPGTTLASSSPATWPSCTATWTATATTSRRAAR
jgi:hypothetical protein